MEDDRRSDVLDIIEADMRADAKNFDGQPFNGRTVAEYFGHQGAAISALTQIMKSILEQLETIESPMVKNSPKGNQMKGELI